MEREVNVCINPSPDSSRLLPSLESKIRNALAEDPNDWTEIDELLRNSKPGMLGDSEEPEKYTALQLAAKYGRLDVLSEFLTRKEFVDDIGSENERGQTALHLAANGGHHEIVETLIQFCEPLSLKSFVNHKSHYHDSEPNEEGGENEVPNDNSFRLLSSQNGQSVEKNVHRTGLHYASAGAHAETVKYLLSIPEVDAGLKDREENTALHLAITHNNTNGIDGSDILKELLASPKVDVNLKGSLGDTPLHRAVRKENIVAVQLLCRHERVLGAQRNHFEMTPLRLAWEVQKKSSNPIQLELVKNTLLRRDDVRRYEEELKSEREVLYTALNALLVGGTLLASVTFAGILATPTLPPKKDFERLHKYLYRHENSTWTNFTEVVFLIENELLYRRVGDIFRGSNNICFFLSVITLMLAIKVPSSTSHKKVPVYVEEEVERLRRRITLVSFCFSLSAICAGVAFVSGGLAKISLTEDDWSDVLYSWKRKKWSLPFTSSLLTTDLMMGGIVFIILFYSVSTEYFSILRNHLSHRVYFPSLRTFLFCFQLLCLLMVPLMVVIVLLILLGLNFVSSTVTLIVVVVLLILLGISFGPSIVKIR